MKFWRLLGEGVWVNEGLIETVEFFLTRTRNEWLKIVNAIWGCKAQQHVFHFPTQHNRLQW